VRWLGPSKSSLFIWSILESQEADGFQCHFVIKHTMYSDEWRFLCRYLYCTLYIINNRRVYTRPYTLLLSTYLCPWTDCNYTLLILPSWWAMYQTPCCNWSFNSTCNKYITTHNTRNDSQGSISRVVNCAIILLHNRPKPKLKRILN